MKVFPNLGPYSHPKKHCLDLYRLLAISSGYLKRECYIFYLFQLGINTLKYFGFQYPSDLYIIHIHEDLSKTTLVSIRFKVVST